MEEKLLEKQYGFYVYKFALTFGLFALSMGVLFFVHNIAIQMLNALFLGFVSAQIAFLGHDAGHRQIAPNARANDLLGLFVANFMSGVSFTWWLDDHNRHHAHTNDIEHDPNLEYPVLAFDESQLHDKRGVARFIVKYQKYFFFPILSMAGVNLKCGTVKYLFENKFPGKRFEIVLCILHYIAYFGVTIGLLGWWAAPFIALHQISYGILLGGVFAPNHKGMPILEGEARRDYLRCQVLTSRNVKAHPVTDFMYGGLNYQIEHHLFPSIPRNKMRRLQAIVKDFCEERSVSYHETTTVGSYKEIMEFLHEVSAPLREKPSTVGAEKKDGA
ncbi:acyl-CoA desaturase [bacterium]|nr:MAG: acyl-CoA desaturase [bacterium]